jgi:hypothetical protein
MSDLLRHTLATLAYRAGKTLHGDGEPYADFRIAPGTRTPREILAHMGDLLDWSLSLVEGCQKWQDSSPLAWMDECARFFAALQKLDSRLASGQPSACTPESLFQGPIADALTHTGQLAMLRRLAGIPIRGENYFVASIALGQVGPDQPEPKREF